MEKSSRAFIRSNRHEDLLPGQHLVDTSYVDADLLEDNQPRYQVDLLGPVPPDGRGLAKDLE